MHGRNQNATVAYFASSTRVEVAGSLLPKGEDERRQVVATIVDKRGEVLKNNLVVVGELVRRDQVAFANFDAINAQVTRGAASPRLHVYPADTPPTGYIATTPFASSAQLQRNGIELQQGVASFVSAEQLEIMLLDGSKLVERAGAVQDAYSLRCAPQVHGATRDAALRPARP